MGEEMKVEDIEALVKLLVKYKLDILEVNGVKIIKQDHSSNDSEGIKDIFEGKEPVLTDDEVDDLLFAHETF